MTSEHNASPLVLILTLDSGKDIAIPIRHINQQSILPIELNYSIIQPTIRQPLPPGLRWQVLERDKHTCKYCGRQSPEVILEIDHIEPWSVSQNDDINNLITSCRDCNRGKSDKMLGVED